ncbi:MAG: chemotaxis protein CheB [Polyangiaceae bacterium]|nr:chemotaxis protein CheB [Polyangiaceae bacterium]
MPTANRIIRVVLADDSDISAAFLERLLEEDPELRVVGRAHNGAELLSLPARQMAHVILADVLMPEVGGLSVIRSLVGECPVIVISSVDPSSPVAAEALALGATAFFCKRHLAQDREAARLREAVKAAAGVSQPPEATQSVVLIVGSTGATGVLETLVREIAGVPVPILVVQHMPEGREQSLSQLLSFGPTSSRVARDGESLALGVIVAPGGRHLRLDTHDRLRLEDSPPVNGHRPSGDVLLQSAVRLGKRAVGIILSGLGSDGAQGMGALAANGGVCLVQHPRDAAASSMPQAALAASSRVRPVRVVDLGRTVRQVVGHGWK